MEEEHQEMLSLFVTNVTERATSPVTVHLTRIVSRSVTTVTVWDTLPGFAPVRGLVEWEGVERTAATLVGNMGICPGTVRVVASVYVTAMMISVTAAGVTAIFRETALLTSGTATSAAALVTFRRSALTQIRGTVEEGTRGETTAATTAESQTTLLVTVTKSPKSPAPQTSRCVTGVTNPGTLPESAPLLKMYVIPAPSQVM